MQRAGKRVKTLVPLLLALLALATAAPAGAQDRGGADDVVVMVGPVTIAEPVGGDVVVFSGGVTVSAPVAGNLVVFSGPATLASGGRIGGDVVYGEQRPDVADAAVGGSITRLSTPGEGFGFAAGFGFWLAYSVSSLLIGLLLLWLAERALQSAFATAAERPGTAVAWGLALVIGLPIVVVLALLTVVGIPFGVALLLAMLPLFAVAYTTSCWLLGRRLVRPPRSPMLAFLAGWAILRVLALVPVAGGLVSFAAVVFGLGVLVIAIWRARTRSRPEARAGEPPPAPA
jgi:hypothetical protein